MKNSVKRASWLWFVVIFALAAALFLAGCKSEPTPCDNPPCGEEPTPNGCDNPPCGEEPTPSDCDNPPCGGGGEEPTPSDCDNPPCGDGGEGEEPTEPEPPDCEKVVGQNFTDETAGLNIDMVFVKCGKITIGCNDCGDYTIVGPAHPVELSGYYIGKYLVTQKQWKALMGKNPSNFTGDDLPVEQVSWNDVQEFITKLNTQSSRKKYRLPTNAEWEYAARGGTKSNGYTYSGGNTVDAVAWHLDNSNDKTHPVGGKNPNELDLYDMSGNVFEWVSDWYGGYSRNSPISKPFVDPQGPATGTSRVIRGGSWAQGTTFCRVYHRTNQLPAETSKLTGFRLALTAE